MRCGCPNCGAFMVHEESGEHVCCVCPACLTRCNACLGTNSVLRKEEVERMKNGEWSPRVQQIQDDLAQVSDEEEAADVSALSDPENPEKTFD